MVHEDRHRRLVPGSPPPSSSGCVCAQVSSAGGHGYVARTHYGTQPVRLLISSIVGRDGPRGRSGSAPVTLRQRFDGLSTSCVDGEDNSVGWSDGMRNVS